MRFQLYKSHCMTDVELKIVKNSSICSLWAFYRPYCDLRIKATDFKFYKYKDYTGMLYVIQFETCLTYYSILFCTFIVPNLCQSRL